MSRYIDRDKLKGMIEAKADTLIEGKQAFLYIAKWLDLLPTADVVSVVRCRDCKHRNSGRMSCQGRHPDWYCPKGERREE